MCKIDWAKIYKNEFLFFEKCYTECGSYCCKNELNGEYALLKRKSVVLPMLEGEYAYYKSQGGISKLQASKVKKEVFSLKDKALTLYYLTCDCFGECNPHCLRPLLCRMYPYFPSVDLEGRILGFLPISLLDVFFSDTSAHKCTLVRDKNAEVQAQLSKSLKPLLEIPLFIFIFKAMEILVRYLREYMESIFATSIASAGGGVFIDKMLVEERMQFFKRYEMAIFFREAWKNEACKQEILEAYEKIVARYGEIL